ncbi:LegC family aminotransferase [Paenibacillus pinistramenti]|uniref:LegC family aminotransferase n=1 Tax=Paenibacillus pinistramenti TaxID=1768003 RepID=UPI0011097A91|nr:LegC family aminotransferase [Paenibacillus pinistramenti]
MKNSKLIPLSVPNLSLTILENVRETIETGWVSTGGRFITEFEAKIAKYTGAPRAVSTQSGTAGLHLALRVLGIEPGDEVIVPSLTFIAAVNPVRYMQAEPVFMDCDDTLNMDMDKLQRFLELECDQVNGQTINRRTKRPVKAVVVVHVFGNPANMDKLMQLKEQYHLHVIEDATEALGSYYLAGRYAGQHCGTIGDIGVYSFNANKIITTGGGGMIVSPHEEYLERAAFLGVQAKTDPLYFIHDEVGYNYRMTNIQAAFGTDQIDQLERFIDAKISSYRLYQAAISDIPGLELYPFRPDTRANHWFYSLYIDEQQYGLNRDELLRQLNERHIQTRPLWGLVHKQKPYRGCLAYEIENACRFEDNLLNIPCSTSLLESELDQVVEALRTLGGTR